MITTYETQGIHLATADDKSWVCYFTNNAVTSIFDKMSLFVTRNKDKSYQRMLQNIKGYYKDLRETTRSRMRLDVNSKHIEMIRPNKTMPTIWILPE